MLQLHEKKDSDSITPPHTISKYWTYLPAEAWDDSCAVALDMSSVIFREVFAINSRTRSPVDFSACTASSCVTFSKLVSFTCTNIGISYTNVNRGSQQPTPVRLTNRLANCSVTISNITAVSYSGQPVTCDWLAVQSGNVIRSGMHWIASAPARASVQQIYTQVRLGILWQVWIRDCSCNVTYKRLVTLSIYRRYTNNFIYLSMVNECPKTMLPDGGLQRFHTGDDNVIRWLR